MSERVSDEALLAALHSASGGVQWVEADAVRRQVDGDITALGAGRRLSRLAQGDHCRRRLNEGGYMWTYRSWRDV